MPNNPFKPDDKVRTKIKGAEVEVIVRAIWNDEVQVRTPSGALLWRTVKTVKPLAAEPASTPASSARDAVESTVTPSEAVPTATEPPSPIGTEQPQPDHTAAGESEPVPPAVEPETTTAAPEPHAANTPAPLHDTATVTPCGVEPVVKPHRKRRRK